MPEARENVFRARERIMIYLTGKDEISLKRTAVTMGKFDGVHLGHQKLMETLKQAKQKGLTTVVFTFQDTPSRVLRRDGAQLMTSHEKCYLYEKSGVDVLIDYPADKQFFALTPEQFIRGILVEQLGIREFICGSDFRFGANRSGDAAYLRDAGTRYGFEVRILEKEQYKDRDISSTYIKEELAKGNLSAVERMQGHPYFFLTKAEQKEWEMTFPEEKLLPKPGKYRCEMTSGGEAAEAVCEVLDNRRVKIAQIKKNCWTDGRECAILFRCM